MSHAMNLEAEREQKRRWYRNNREKVIQRSNAWCRNNPEKRREVQRRWYWNNIEKERERTRRWRRKNPEKQREYRRAWDKAHPEIYRGVSARVSCQIRKCLRRVNKGPKAFRRSEDLLGYTMRALENSLKHKIPKGYTWQDYIDGKLHLDHKIPISAFNIKDAEDLAFRECWSLNNLQLLPAKDNKTKGDKIEGHFQAFLPLLIP